MMDRMQTFVVRLWAPALPGEAAGEMRGVVEHVTSGDKAQFHTAVELIEFLRRAGGQGLPGSVETAPGEREHG